MSTEWGWYHPTDESEQWDGFNDSGIEHFRGKPLTHLAREVIQNSLDAKDSYERPVTVRIRMHSVPTASVPGIDELRQHIDLCRVEAKNESRKADIFFKQAQRELEKTQIEVLEISDFNTKGLAGPCENGTPFFAFLKATGQSVKQSDTASGSYGIGKFAPYAVSKLRTVFVSTVYTEGVQSYQLTQGKAILMSHISDGATKQGNGFWGIKERCRPVAGVCFEIPAWIQRTKRENLQDCNGTKLSILGFTAPPNWETSLAVSVAENFFGAIYDGDLVVHLNDTYSITKDTILELFHDASIRAIAEDLQDASDSFDTYKNYLLCLANDKDVVVRDTIIEELGEVRLRLLLGDGLHKRVCFLRNGMFITDQLARLKRFGDYKDFAGVVQCMSPKGNELLRAMEPPRHDDFEPDRLSTENEKRRGATALRKLATWVRKELKEHAQEPVTEVTEIDELRDFFGDETYDGDGQGIEEINPFGKVVIRAKSTPRKRITVAMGGDEVASGYDGVDGNGRDNNGNGGGGRGRSTGRQSGGGKSSRPAKTEVILGNVRAVALGEKEKRLSFTPDLSGDIECSVFASGADVDYMIPVSKSNGGSVVDGRFRLSVRKDERYSVTLELVEEFDGAVKVVAYEI